MKSHQNSKPNKALQPTATPPLRLRFATAPRRLSSGVGRYERTFLHIRFFCCFRLGLCWRCLVLNVPVAFALQAIPAASPATKLLLAFAQLASVCFCFWGAAHWLRARGFGSVRVMLVEWADYQEAKSNERVQQVAQADSPSSVGPAA